ncbi:hypothetical protein C2G38_2203095 [Gigaspora rosea]|uniref:Uncharacterized protein n=1 Tax=Gigaspora rosea TaxID=44941 RepID=A0A397US24_9GLOM|nr:hypothetical protein C2G38_2203095 [Gigaspora rosea]
MTVVGKETTHEVLRKDQDFSFHEASCDVIEKFFNKFNIPPDIILDFKSFFQFLKTESSVASDIQACYSRENVKIVRDYVTGKLKHLISRLQKTILKAMDLYIGECVEPKVIRDSRKTFTCIIAIPAANIIVGEDSYDNEDLLESFRDLTSSIIKLVWILPILSFIHPWPHQQFVT